MFNIDKNDLNLVYRVDNENFQAIKQHQLRASAIDSSSSKIEDDFGRFVMLGSNMTAAASTLAAASYSDQQFDASTYYTAVDQNYTIHDRIDQIVAQINLGSMFFGIIGNLVCISVLVQKPLLNRKFNWYLLLLAIADLFFSIIVFFNYYIVLNNPVTALYDLSRITCYFTDYIVSCIDSFCVFLTLILSMDRLYAIKKPIKSKMFFTYRFPKRIAIIGYVSLLVIRSPELIFNQREYISPEMAADTANRSNSTWDVTNSPGGYCSKAFDTNGENKHVIIYIYYCNIIIPLLLNIIPAFIIIGLNSALWFFIRHYTRISANYKLGTSLSTSFKVSNFKNNNNESSTMVITSRRRKSKHKPSSAESSMTTSFTYMQRFCKNRVTKTQKSYYLTIIMLGLWLLLTTIPYYTFFTYYWVTTLKRIENQTRLMLTMQGISSAFFNSNHCINIIIYFLFHKDFRSNAFNLFIKLFNVNPIVKMNPLFFNNNNSSLNNRYRSGAETTCGGAADMMANRRAGGGKKSMPELDSTYRTLFRMNLKRLGKLNQQTNGAVGNDAGLLLGGENNHKRIGARLSEGDTLKLVVAAAAAKPSSSAIGDGRVSMTSDFNDEEVHEKQTWKHNQGDKYMKNVNLIYSYSSSHLNNLKPSSGPNSNSDSPTANHNAAHHGEYLKTISFESTSNEHINKDYECSTNTTNRSGVGAGELLGKRASRAINCLDSSYNATYQSYMDLNLKEQNSRKLFIPNEKFLKIFRSKQRRRRRGPHTDGKISLPATGSSPDSDSSPCKTNKKSYHAGVDLVNNAPFDFSINSIGQHHHHEQKTPRKNRFFSLANLF